MKTIYSYIYIALIFLLLVGCNKEDPKSTRELYTVKRDKISQPLFYSGIIQPLQATVVQSKTEGVLVKMIKQYGESVKKGELLFVVSSTKFLTDYKTALLQYIKAKNEFHQAETQLNEANFLHKNELISNDEFKLKQSAYYSAQLALIQGKDALRIFLNQLNLPEDKLFNLSIADIEKVKEAMHLTTHAEHLNIMAPLDGILLAPFKSD